MITDAAIAETVALFGRLDHYIGGLKPTKKPAASRLAAKNGGPTRRVLNSPI